MQSHSWHDPHMIRAIKSLFRALYATLGVFLFMFVFFHIGSALYASSLAAKTVGALQGGIAKDTSHLKEGGDAVAKNNLLIDALLAGNIENLLPILQEEKNRRDIRLIGITNAEGVILGRTWLNSRIGNNVFLTTPQGRIVSSGKSVESIEVSGLNPAQLNITTGRPIMQGSTMIGSLFASYPMDDAYAVRFRNAYLNKGTEVIFYTKDFGIYGNSFSDSEIRKLTNSYFNSGSEWIRGGNSDKTLFFKDNSFYLVENIIFSGLEGNPGGALLFIPRRDISPIANLTTAFLTLLVFVFFALRYHIRTQGEERGWRYYALILIFSLPILGLAFFALYAQNSGFLQLKRVPYTLYNSTLRFQPEWGIYDETFEQHFSIIADSGDDPINAVQIGFTFDPKAVEIKTLDTASSSCSYIIESVINMQSGMARFSCVILDSGGDRRSYLIADVVAMPRRAGAFSLSFDATQTKVLANDGLGTDVLRAAQGGNYIVGNFDSKAVSDTTGAASKGIPLVVFSPTHPNQNRWYNARTARFVWRGKPGAVYAYVFNSSPDTTPSRTRTIQDSMVDLSIPGDGIFFFHLQLASGGPVAHYRVQTDTTPPSVVSINFSEGKVVAGDIVRFSFEAEDIGSGIGRNYYVDLGNRLFLPVGSQLFIPFLEAGDKKIALRVYDNAGNYSEKSQIIHVEAPRGTTPF